MKLSIGPALARKKMSQAELANRIGVSKGFVSEMISGKKRPSTETLQSIALALDVSISELYEQRGTFTYDARSEIGQSGFSEAKPAEFTGRKNLLSEAASNLISPDIRHQTHYVATKAMLGFGILAGDILVVELQHRAETGDLVIAKIADPETSTSTTVVRRLYGNILASSDNEAPPIDLSQNDQNAAVLGTIEGLIRGKLPLPT